jgi:hypothetical protein
MGRFLVPENYVEACFQCALVFRSPMRAALCIVVSASENAGSQRPFLGEVRRCDFFRFQVRRVRHILERFIPSPNDTGPSGDVLVS